MFSVRYALLKVNDNVVDVVDMVLDNILTTEAHLP